MKKLFKKLKKYIKGFTLVELLAVIVILAIIMIIAIPSVLGTLEDARKKSFEEYVTKTINLAESQNLAGDLFSDNSNKCTIYNIKTELDLAGTGSYDGYILITGAEESESIIIMWDDTRMLLPYNYTKRINSNGESKSIIESIVDYDGSRLEELSSKNLCSYGCSTCSAGGNSIAASCDYSVGETFDFDYIGDIDKFNVSCTGDYKLEVWGAQGGAAPGKYQGGYGAYSVGTIHLIKNNKIYITVGGKGEDGLPNSGIGNGGYNGGGKGRSWNEQQALGGGGGGATHISYQKNLLKDLENNKDAVIIVAGAGGGASYTNGVNGSVPGNGGGFKGTSITKALRDAALDGRRSNPGTQEAGGCSSNGTSCGGFGYGATPKDKKNNASYYDRGGGGGSGYYGGSSAFLNSGSGGSGFIGNSSLKDKHMTCYNCEESNIISTKTISNTCVSSTPSVDCSKTGNGYAKITYLG